MPVGRVVEKLRAGKGRGRRESLTVLEASVASGLGKRALAAARERGVGLDELVGNALEQFLGQGMAGLASGGSSDGHADGVAGRKAVMHGALVPVQADQAGALGISSVRMVPTRVVRRGKSGNSEA